MTDTKRIAGGAAISNLAMVSADQETIFGNGTSENPLRAVRPADAPEFTAAFRGGVLLPRPGHPVFISVVPEIGGVTTVQPGTATEDFGLAQIAGVVIRVNDDDTVQVQSSGVVELTEEEWATVTEDAGGLRLGEASS
jgi:hypothetical protein